MAGFVRQDKGDLHSPGITWAPVQTEQQSLRKEAVHYKKVEWDAINCNLCPHQCSVAPSRSGNCGVRMNRNGSFYSDNYGKVAKKEIRPSVQMPLFHFHPEMVWMVAGMKGCTMRCNFCNTSQYSLVGATTTEPMTPEALVYDAARQNFGGLAFGINEPVVSHEYVLDTFAVAKKRELKTALLTNGSWMEDAFLDVIPDTDAFVFGIKGFNDRRTTSELGGHLEFILKNIETAIARKKHVEIHYLVLGTLEEATSEAFDLIEWIKEISPLIPVIVQRQVTSYLKTEETETETSQQVYQILKENLTYVYNLDNAETLNSRCRHCNEITITRSDQSALISFGNDHLCPGCREPLDIVSG